MRFLIAATIWVIAGAALTLFGLQLWDALQDSRGKR